MVPLEKGGGKGLQTTFMGCDAGQGFKGKRRKTDDLFKLQGGGKGGGEKRPCCGIKRICILRTRDRVERALGSVDAVVTIRVNVIKEGLKVAKGWGKKLRATRGG